MVRLSTDTRISQDPCHRFLHRQVCLANVAEIFVRVQAQAA